EFPKNIAQRPTNSSGLLRTAARDHRSAERVRECRRYVFGDVYQGADQPEFLVSGISNSGEGAEAAREHCISQERFTEIVGCMAESDHVGAEAARNLIDGPAPVAAAQVASVVGLLFEQPEG